MLSSGCSITIAGRSRQQLWLLAQGLKKKEGKRVEEETHENRKGREGVEETREEEGSLRRRT